MTTVRDINFDNNHVFITVKVMHSSVSEESEYSYGAEEGANDSDAWDTEVSHVYESMREYLEWYGYDIVASAVGRHIDGKNKKPHSHIHYIAKVEVGKLKGAIHRNDAARNRKLYFEKHSKKSNPICEVKYQDIEQNGHTVHGSMLSYPFKEGSPHPNRNFQMYDKKPMTNVMYDSCLEYGKSLWQAAKAERDRKERAQEGSRSVRMDILAVAQKGVNKGIVSSYRELLNYLDDEYIGKLDFNDYPRPNDYKIHCQQIAVKLRIAKYSDFC